MQVVGISSFDPVNFTLFEISGDVELERGGGNSGGSDGSSGGGGGRSGAGHSGRSRCGAGQCGGVDITLSHPMVCPVLMVPVVTIAADVVKRFTAFGGEILVGLTQSMRGTFGSVR